MQKNLRLGLVIGMSLASALMGVVGSAVSTVSVGREAFIVSYSFLLLISKASPLYMPLIHFFCNRLLFAMLRLLASFKRITQTLAMK